METEPVVIAASPFAAPTLHGTSDAVRFAPDVAEHRIFSTGSGTVKVLCYGMSPPTMRQLEPTGDTTS